MKTLITICFLLCSCGGEPHCNLYGYTPQGICVENKTGKELSTTALGAIISAVESIIDPSEVRENYEIISIIVHNERYFWNKSGRAYAETTTDLDYIDLHIPWKPDMCDSLLPHEYLHAIQYSNAPPRQCGGTCGHPPYLFDQLPKILDLCNTLW